MVDAEGHPSRDEMELPVILNALSDPLRYKVIQEFLELPDGTERTCLSFGLGVSKSTLSHHFRVLRESGLVQQINRGNSRKAHLRREDLEERFPGLLELISRNPAPAAGTAKDDADAGAAAPSRSGSDRPGRATGP
ncbi:helix-turn-helix domain-containing protein [Kitasatospora sp. NPDC097643]|uniref:ArsR/SmtB family transcription factor n=1 Tax=Kitasatospora sp. NPDC097643 TaxID=3157230 RepID=UPI00331A1F05